MSSFMRQKVQFPLTRNDPRPGAPDGATITFTDARSYFDTLLACAGPAIAAYEEFIMKYQEQDARDGREPD